MSAIGGPDIVEDGLVLTLDAANIKSFKGEPTTNIIADPQFTSYTNSTAGDSSIIKVNFGEGRVGIQMIQTSTTNIVSFPLSSGNTTPTSGQTYTLSAEVFGNKTGALVKSQVSVFVNGVRHWLTDSNNWTTTVTENSLFFRPTQLNSWHKTATTFTFPLGTLTNFSFSGFYRNTGDFILRITNVQLEAKPYATTFVNGTRGTTVATGGGWADRSGNDNHGELVNGPTYDSGNGGSIVFDGVNDRVQTNVPLYTNSRLFTFMFWLRTSSVITPADRRGIFSVRNQPMGYISLMGITPGSDGIARLLFESRDSTNSTYGSVSSSTFNLYSTNWVMVGFQIAPSSISVFYNNGISSDMTTVQDTRTGFSFRGFSIGMDSSSLRLWQLYTHQKL
jgi:hypothetical protein